MGNEENKSPDLGGLVLPDSDKSASNGAPDTNVSASASVIRERKKRSDAGQPRGPRSAKSADGLQSVSQPVISQQQFAQLYSPQLWEKAVCAPADAMAAVTGKAYWQISTGEREAVGASCSIAAQCFAVTDPRWLAASLAIVTVLDIYGVRFAMWMQEKNREKEEAEKKKKAEGGFRAQV